jgi:NitT/TauT family transport system substrate-binding protein
VSIAVTALAEFNSGFLLAQEFGEFAKENLKVTLSRVASADSYLLMTQGKIHLRSGGIDVPMLNLITQKDAVRQVGHVFDLNKDSKEGFWVRNEYFNADGSVNKAKIPGMSINPGAQGASSSSTLAVIAWLKDNGYTLKDVKVTSLNFGDDIVALGNSAIQAAYVITPFWNKLEQTNVARYINGSGFSLASYTMPTDFMKNQPDVARAIMRAIVRTTQTYLQGDYHKDPKILAALVKVLNTPEASITGVLPLNFVPDLMFAKVSLDAMQACQDMWLSQPGTLQYQQALPLDKLVDMSLVQDVLAGK